ncbi:hypothetical protein ACH5RR_037261 [Cinchona calisaya]|uniref:Uncharacterized protein n=1 Tax=Cinchona calisaya TaxID=153742 RepID=A0ABD2Y5L8_9GENT
MKEGTILGLASLEKLMRVIKGEVTRENAKKVDGAFKKTEVDYKKSKTPATKKGAGCSKAKGQDPVGKMKGGQKTIPNPANTTNLKRTAEGNLVDNNSPKDAKGTNEASSSNKNIDTFE